MKQGDIVVIRDTSSDLYLRKGEVLAINKSKVLVYLKVGKHYFVADLFSRSKISKYKFKVL